MNTIKDHPLLGKYTAPARSFTIVRAEAEELRAAYSRIAELEASLGEVREYFEERADADCDQDGFIPNEEMKRMIEIDEVLL